MRTWIVSYADAAFRLSQERLMQSAARFGIDERRAWSREALARTAFHAAHHDVLDEPRGSGYWLWKPFIINETLRDMAPGELLVYADAGIEIVGDLAPLFEICRSSAEVLLFAGHYDDVAAPGPNLCGKWTKRDCFVLMDCDEPAFHHGRMIDASFIVMRNTPRAVAITREWFLWCCQRPILTDDANVCGVPDLPEFIAHRHDQSVLSLLALREGLELFRHPSQHGNHLKLEPFRVPGEWLRGPYGSKGIFHNSPYGTLLNHHRGHLGEAGLRVELERVLPMSRDRVFCAWTAPHVLVKWSPGVIALRILSAETDVRTGGGYALTMTSSSSAGPQTIRGTYLEVHRPARLVYDWPWQTQVTVDFHDAGDSTIVALTHGAFPSEPLRAHHARAWESFLDTVASALDDERVGRADDRGTTDAGS